MTPPLQLSKQQGLNQPRLAPLRILQLLLQLLLLLLLLLRLLRWRPLGQR